MSDFKDLYTVYSHALLLWCSCIGILKYKFQFTGSIKIWDAVNNIGGLQGGHMGSQIIIVLLQ